MLPSQPKIHGPRPQARDRANILFRTYEGILARRDEFARLIVDEMGKPWSEAQTEVDYGAGFFRWFAESDGRIHTEGQYGVEPGGNYQIAVSKRPVGPSLLITPWNFPLAMGTRKIAPALAAGCTTVLKPAVQTPFTSLHLAQVLQEAGTPAGVLNVIVTGNSRGVIGAIMADQRRRFRCHTQPAAGFHDRTATQLPSRRRPRRPRRGLAIAAVRPFGTTSHLSRARCFINEEA